MGDIHKRLTEKNFLKGLAPAEFAKEAAEIIGDINYVHPFREGNGRAQMHYLDQLAHNAGHYMDLSLIPQDQWIEASRKAHEANYGGMADCIAEGVVSMPSRSESYERGDEGRER